jgi:hypothetical protein
MATKQQQQKQRRQIAREAARLMVEEDVGEYFTAKRTAARRLFGKHALNTLHFRPKSLPSNGEIREQILQLVAFTEGETVPKRLFAMRMIARDTMQQLEPFCPRLIGSVSTGHVRKGSDIDLHVFTDHPELLEEHMQSLGWHPEKRIVSIRKQNQIKDFLHYYIERAFPVELSVYPIHEKRIQQRSSTDGKPIVRVSLKQLQQRIETEHPQLWNEYLHTNIIPDLHTLSQHQAIASLAERESECEYDDDDPEYDEDYHEYDDHDTLYRDL